MPQPPEIDALVDQLIELYEGVQTDLAEQLANLPDGRIRRRARLRAMARQVDRDLAQLQSDAKAWLERTYPQVYARGAADAAASIDEPWTWTDTDRAAVVELAQDTFDDLLATNTQVAASTKRALRRIARDQTAYTLIEGVPVAQASREAARQAGVATVTYRNGAVHTVADYMDTILRTRSAVVYNRGSFGFTRSAGIRYMECFDGIGCGLSAHGDGPDVNGQVFPIETAEAYPVAHFRCRRSWSPRPDVTTGDDAASAAPSTTVAQRADQAASERQREALVKRRAARRPRETRRGRTPRAPRSS